MHHHAAPAAPADHLAEIDDIALLPPLLQDFVRLIGLPATLALVRAYGGLRIYIPSPARAHPEHALAQHIGHQALQALAQVYGSESHFALPKATHALTALRNRRIARAYASSQTARALAAQYNLTERHVERIVAAAGITAPAQRRQMPLL